MNDFIWFLVTGIVFGLLGLVFLWLGFLIWKKQRINLVIRHHMDKISDENKQTFCKLFGIGVFIIGIGFTVSGICMLFMIDMFSWIPMTIGLAGGILLMTMSILRYNY
jgi:hypothetical protein